MAFHKPEDLLGNRELAFLLDYTERHITWLYQEKRLPGKIQVGPGRWKWLKAEIVAWMEAGFPPREQWEKTRHEKFNKPKL